jgi:hypothetical protein
VNKQEIYNLITKTIDRYNEDEKITEDEYLDILVKIKDLTEEYSTDVLSINYHLRKELDQCKNNWEELKKMFEADEHFEDGCYCSEILNKMKELEEDK